MRRRRSLPDGMRIAWERHTFGIETEEIDIWVANADGTGAVNLTNNPATYDSNPTWSPDGERIAYISRPIDEGFSDIWIIDSDPDSVAIPVNRTQSTFTIEADPAWRWTPDGSLIAYAASADSDFDIYVLNPDTMDAPVLLTPEAMFSTRTFTRRGRLEAQRLSSNGSSGVRATPTSGSWTRMAAICTTSPLRTSNRTRILRTTWSRTGARWTTRSRRRPSKMCPRLPCPAAPVGGAPAAGQINQGEAFYNVTFGTSFASIDSACIRFYFATDLLEPGETLGSSSPKGRCTNSHRPTRWISPRYVPGDIPDFLDGEKFFIVELDGDSDASVNILGVVVALGNAVASSPIVYDVVPQSASATTPGGETLHQDVTWQDQEDSEECCPIVQVFLDVDPAVSASATPASGMPTFHLRFVRQRPGEHRCGTLLGNRYRYSRRPDAHDGVRRDGRRRRRAADTDAYAPQ